MASKRERRQFDSAFKSDAVRRMQERLAVTVPLAEIARSRRATPTSSARDRAGSRPPGREGARGLPWRGARAQ